MWLRTRLGLSSGGGGRAGGRRGRPGRSWSSRRCRSRRSRGPCRPSLEKKSSIIRDEKTFKVEW
jgi:hypothetical protein